MTQAQPQFTPVQILEAGQRAVQDGRRDYAVQFFQHLIDHYSQTPEAHRARDALARLNAAMPPAYANGHAVDQPQHRHAEPPQPPEPGGRSSTTQHPDVPSRGETLHRREPAFGSSSPASEMHHPQPSPPIQTPPIQSRPIQNRPIQNRPGHLAPGQFAPGHLAPGQFAPGQHEPGQQHAVPVAQQPVPQGRAAARHQIVPAPEKHYIAGRVVAGLVLLVGVLGLFASFGLVYVAISDPKLFAIVGAQGFRAAITVAASVLLGSMAMVIAAQIAMAIFNGADAATELARLERFRLGDTDEA